MPSISVLNAVLNAALWLVHSLIALILQAVYVSISRIQLATEGKTRATDSNETNVFHWLSNSVPMPGRKLSMFSTAIWSFALMLFALLFLPAELVFETGIDVSMNCTAQVINSSVGVCSSRWQGHSDIGIASAALLVQRFTWIDDDWDIIFEGSSKRMNAAEVHREASSNLKMLSSESRKIFANNCQNRISECADCGSLHLLRNNGPFSTTATQATLAMSGNLGNGSSPERYALGDVTHDGVFGSAFLFWEMPKEVVTNAKGTKMTRIRIKGVETILSQSEIDRVLEDSENQNEGWDISLDSRRTRVYDMKCDTPGLTSADFARAVSLYRTTQLEQPGVQQSDIGEDLRRFTPLSTSDCLKALFSMKAEDGTSTCSGEIPVYRTCGSFDWTKATYIVGLSVFVVFAWISLSLASREYSRFDVPHDSRSWRAYALSGGSTECTVEADRVRGIGSCVVVLKSMRDQYDSEIYES